MVLAPFGRRACLVAVLSLIPATVLAQGASTATIAGVVHDSSGAVLPGVTVEAGSPALIERVRTTVTDDRGQYRLPELRPGTYSVTFSLAGFSTFKRDGLELRTNFTAQVDAELKVSDIQETITVSGATPLVDVSTATQQRTVTREVLDSVPTAKSVLGIAALIPAVVEPPNAQDVGGSKGERSVRITVHGGKIRRNRKVHRTVITLQLGLCKHILNQPSDSMPFAIHLNLAGFNSGDACCFGNQPAQPFGFLVNDGQQLVPLRGVGYVGREQCRRGSFNRGQGRFEFVSETVEQR